MEGGEKAAVVREMKDSVLATGDHSQAIHTKNYIKEQHFHQISEASNSTASYRQAYLEEVAKVTNLLPLSSVSVAFAEPNNLPNHPVVGVMWYEALAFTRWLTDEMKKNSSLPESCTVQLSNEPEWEKAARGTDGQTYPWGHNKDPKNANYADTGIDATSAVGCFPGEISPFGVEDMSGNVWEWTRSMWSEEEYPSVRSKWKKREELAAFREEGRVVRGGSFDFTDYNLGCASRNDLHSNFRSSSLGFRVVVSPCSSL